MKPAYLFAAALFLLRFGTVVPASSQESLPEKPRAWRDDTDTFSAVGRFVKVEKGLVQIETVDGIRSVPVDRLSRGDRQYLLEMRSRLLAEQLRILWKRYQVAPGEFDVREVDGNLGLVKGDDGGLFSLSGEPQLGIYLRRESGEIKVFQSPSADLMRLHPGDKEARTQVNEINSRVSGGEFLPFAAFMIRHALPARELTGSVLKIDGDEVVISLGTNHRVRSGAQFRVIRVGEELVDPKTGEKLGADTKEVGLLYVWEVGQKTARARHYRQPPPGQPQPEQKVPKFQVGDVVKFDAKGAAVAVLMLGNGSDVTTDGISKRPAKANEVIGVIESVAGLRRQDNTTGELLTTELVRYEVPVVERTLLQRVLNQLRLQEEKQVFDPKATREFGQQVGASYIVGGMVTDGIPHIRLIDVATGEVLLALSNAPADTAPVPRRLAPPAPQYPLSPGKLPR